MNGSFFFRDGEEGTRSIDLRILPHGEVEVEETFVIELSILSGELDVDPQAGFITLKVLHCFMSARFVSPSQISCELVNDKNWCLLYCIRQLLLKSV